MTPEAVAEASRLIFLLDRAETLLCEVRIRSDIAFVGDVQFPGPSRFDRLHVSSIAAELESTGVTIEDLGAVIRVYLDETIDAQAVKLRTRLADLGVDLPARPEPTVRSEPNESLS